MRAECSRKITFLNYVLSGLIVLLHSCDIIRTTEFSAVVENGEIILICKMLERLGKVAVPTFFALSGYLFFRDCNYQNIRRKITSRMKSLVIPFCFWNIFFYCVYIALNNVPGIGSRINFEIPRFWVKAFIINNVVNPPMWFLSRLIVLHISALIGLFLFKKIRSYNLSWIIALMTVDLIIGFGYQSPLHWGGVYYLGGYMAYFYSDVVENKGVFGRIPTVIRGILLGGAGDCDPFSVGMDFCTTVGMACNGHAKGFQCKANYEGIVFHNVYPLLWGTCCKEGSNNTFGDKSAGNVAKSPSDCRGCVFTGIDCRHVVQKMDAKSAHIGLRRKMIAGA